MGIKIKNLQTGEFEKFNIPALKGEKGEPGEIESSEKVDYIGKQHSKLRDTMNANVDYIIKTAIGEFNYLDYEGQHITANNSIEGHAKSAILKGQTLVNIKGEITTDLIFGVDKKYRTEYLIPIVKKNKDYYIKYEVECDDNPNAILAIGFLSSATTWSKNLENQPLKGSFILNSGNNPNYFRIIGRTDESTTGITVLKLLIIEYQEGMENWNIPYFEGMQSVKMPVLMTRNNLNLLDTNPNSWISTTNAVEAKHNIIVSPNKVYSFHNVRGSWVDIVAYNDSRDEISKIVSINGAIGTTKTVFTTPNDCASLKVILKLTTDTTEPNRLKLRLFEGEIDLGYPPYSEVYKSNILSTPSDLELRGIGDVQDELDLLTGEVTERIGEVVFDGSEEWYSTNKETNNYIMFRSSPFRVKFIPPICDRFKTYSTHMPNITESNGELLNLQTDNNCFQFIIKKEKLSSNNAEGFKQWLSQNPTTVQYQLETESIKTVDLSDNHVYSYKGTTHYDCSSAEGSLVPTLSIDVPTNLPAVVTRQRVTIQELEKENVALKNEIEETANSSVNGDLELMSSQFELDFRLFEIEMNLDMPMMAMMRGVKSMAMTVYQQAKTLILAGKYEREDMEYKLNRYKAAGRITVEEYDELIALMDARELVD